MSDTTTATPFLGVDHIGVGTADADAARAFYSELGFGQVAFDRELELGGLREVAGRDVVRARVVLLRSDNETPLGMAAVKLVQVLDEEVPPMPEAMAWGEPGVCEVCVHVRGQADLYERLVAAGHTGLMEPNTSPLPPYGTRCSLSYVQDPDGTKIELIEWLDLEAGWPGEDGPQGVNHVAFGVTDIDATRDFYRPLGFGGLLFESDGHFEPMDPWYAPRPAPRQRMMLLTNPHGGGMEPVQHTPPSEPKHGAWGHRGPFDFGIGVRNMDRAVGALGAAGVELAGPVHHVDLGGEGAWSYVYLRDPDGTRVCLSELRA